MRWTLTKHVARAGTRPSQQLRESFISVYEHEATASDGSNLHAMYSAVDPAFGNTAPQLVQVSMLLVEDARRLIGCAADGQQ